MTLRPTASASMSPPIFAGLASSFDEGPRLAAPVVSALAIQAFGVGL